MKMEIWKIHWCLAILTILYHISLIYFYEFGIINLKEILLQEWYSIYQRNQKNGFSYRFTTVMRTSLYGEEHLSV